MRLAAAAVEVAARHVAARQPEQVAARLSHWLPAWIRTRWRREDAGPARVPVLPVPVLDEEALPAERPAEPLRPLRSLRGS